MVSGLVTSYIEFPLQPEGGLRILNFSWCSELILYVLFFWALISDTIVILPWLLHQSFMAFIVIAFIIMYLAVWDKFCRRKYQNGHLNMSGIRFQSIRKQFGVSLLCLLITGVFSPCVAASPQGFIFPPVCQQDPGLLLIRVYYWLLWYSSMWDPRESPGLLNGLQTTVQLVMKENKWAFRCRDVHVASCAVEQSAREQPEVKKKNQIQSKRTEKPAKNNKNSTKTTFRKDKVCG